MKIIKAKFKPRPGSNFPRRELNCANQTFDFIFAFKLKNGSRHWEPVDILFPSSIPIDERDLEFKQKLAKTY